MAPQTLPPHDLILQLLDYDPATGIFVWKSRPREMFTAERSFNTWNARFAGKPAGTLMANGYLGITLKCISARHYAHRLAWLYVHNKPVPVGIDHIDGNPLNNKIFNLRAASQTENMANARLRCNNTTGFKGVVRRGQRYFAQIKHQGTCNYLGTFDTAEKAAEAYREAAIKLFGEFARC